MKNIKYILPALLLSLGAFSGKAAGDQSTEAVIQQIAPLQWTVTWEDYLSTNPANCILDKNNIAFRAFLTSEDGNKTYLYYNKEITFPDYGKYIRVNLEGLNLADGKYELTIPEGYVQIIPGGGLPWEQNVTQYLDITIGGSGSFPHEVSFSEIDGNIFDISWENVTTLAPGKTEGAYMVNQSTGTRYDLHYLVGEKYSSANLRIVNDFLRVNVSANYPDLPSGTYKFYLPAGYMKFNGSDETNEAIDGHEFTYMTPWSEGNVEVNGPDKDGLITVEWTDASEVALNPSYRGDGVGINGITLFAGDNQFNLTSANYTLASPVLTVNIGNLDVPSGSCRLLVPEEFLSVTVDGETGLSAGVYYDFIYDNPDNPGKPDNPDYPQYSGSPKWSVKEGDTVKNGTFVEVNWGQSILTYNDLCEDEVSVYGSIATGYRELTFGTEVKISADGNKLLIDLGSLPSEIYRINIPEAYVLIEAGGETYVNQATSVDYIIVENGAGVEGIPTEDGRYRVFSVSGVMILDSDNSSDIMQLPKGLYIINGRKVVK